MNINKTKHLADHNRTPACYLGANGWHGHIQLEQVAISKLAFFNNQKDEQLRDFWESTWLDNASLHFMGPTTNCDNNCLQISNDG